MPSRKQSACKARRKGDWHPHLSQTRGEVDYTGLRTLEAGQELNIWVNQGFRHAKVLAVLGPEAILEYVMPGGRSALRKVPHAHWRSADPGRPYKNVSYRQIPKVWLIAIIRDGVDWDWASPQGAPDLHMSPREAFLAKWPDDEWMLDT